MSGNDLSPISKIIVVGAGVNGLALAIALSLSNPKYSLQVLERRPYNAASSAAVSGLHLKPNSARLLNAWDVSQFFDRATVVSATTIRRYTDGSVITTQQRPQSRDRASQKNAATWYTNRGDLWTALYDRALATGVTVDFGQSVKEVDVDKPSVTLEDGSSLDCDLLIGADGKKAAVHCQRAM